MEGKGWALGSNWPAFFLGPFWMLYRRMYRTLALVIGGLVLASVIGIGVKALLHPGAPLTESAGGAVGSLPIMAVVTGMGGTYWYYVETRRRYLRLSTGDAAEVGMGVSWVAAGVGVAVLIGIGVLAALVG